MCDKSHSDCRCEPRFVRLQNAMKCIGGHLVRRTSKNRNTQYYARESVLSGRHKALEAAKGQGRPNYFDSIGSAFYRLYSSIVSCPKRTRVNYIHSRSAYDFVRDQEVKAFLP
ncbi:hypothetical protein J6590_105971 [Homalodisca vitripennis]|nr:hypothetical protein J6590_105971 [Homalodisca vitripennis]